MPTNHMRSMATYLAKRSSMQPTGPPTRSTLSSEASAMLKETSMTSSNLLRYLLAALPDSFELMPPLRAFDLARHLEFFCHPSQRWRGRQIPHQCRKHDRNDPEQLVTSPAPFRFPPMLSPSLLPSAESIQPDLPLPLHLPLVALYRRMLAPCEYDRL